VVSLAERYAKQIASVLSCFDRITITSTLPGIYYADGMAGYLAVNAAWIFSQNQSLLTPSFASIIYYITDYGYFFGERLRIARRAYIY